ncbi:MAG TPA: flavodoxin family protein [Candidatus Eisenbacteria bacterium]|jgi:multimeric flavodoxin WrbA
MATDSGKKDGDGPRVVKGDQNFTLDREAFRARLLERFNDPGFETVSEHLEKVIDIAWDAYMGYRKSPRTRKAGPEFADPEFQLPMEWLQTRRRIQEAQARHDDPKSPARILVINGSARSDQTCPGEISKTYRLAKIAREAIAAQKGCEVDFLDLSRLTGEFGLVIYPCKACVSTAQPLCHWPCTCYPNHALRQTGDWMHEIYPRWIAAHGVMILTPVNWYQAPSVLKLMIDRLVCADGGNPDPTTTRGKDPATAKAIELKGWPYPKHLAGRAFSVVVHADAAGAENLRRILVDWMTDLEMIPAGPIAGIDRFIGYYEPYATSHDDLDKDVDVQQEVHNTALELVETVRQIRSGQYKRPDAGLEEPRKK